MSDARIPVPAPDDWGQAFAALPLETPPPGGWTRLAATLPQRRSRVRVWIPAAVAASLALAVAWPWRAPRTEAIAPVPAIASTTTVPAPESPPMPAASTTTPTDPSPARADSVASTGGDKPSAGKAADAGTRAATTIAPRGTRESSPVLAGIDDTASARASADAGGSAASDVTATATAITATAATADAATALEPLYAESAQLEALLAQIRDDRVASGPAMALSAELHERMTSIDVALSQPDLDAESRLRLWRERVATLQRLAGVEGTQRWMAANGFRADGEVAQLY